MNRLTIFNASPGGCDECADVGKVLVDIPTWNILAPVACPVCRDPKPLHALLDPLGDYLTRPKAPGGGAA